MARALMWFFAVTNLGFLVWALINPEAIAAFVGLSAVAPDAQAELRAMYGGLIGGLGVLNLVGAIRPNRLNSAVWATAWVFTGVGLVRAGSCAHYGIGGWQLVFAVSEVAAAITCFWLLQRLECTQAG